MRTPDDLARQMQKVADVLAVVDRHLTAEASMNAALHMAETVRPAPLAVAVSAAKDDLLRLIGEMSEEALTA